MKIVPELNSKEIILKDPGNLISLTRNIILSGIELSESFKEKINQELGLEGVFKKLVLNGGRGIFIGNKNQEINWLVRYIEKLNIPIVIFAELKTIKFWAKLFQNYNINIISKKFNSLPKKIKNKLIYSAEFNIDTTVNIFQTNPYKPIDVFEIPLNSFIIFENLHNYSSGNYKQYIIKNFWSIISIMDSITTESQLVSFCQNRSLLEFLAWNEEQQQSILKIHQLVETHHKFTSSTPSYSNLGTKSIELLLNSDIILT